MIFKTNYNMEEASIYDKRFEINELPSETIPGQAMSIQELLRRHAAGLPLDGQRVPFYEGDEETEDSELQGHPDLNTMDLVDRQEYIEQQELRLAQLKDKFAKEKAHRSEIAKRTKALEQDQGTTDAQPRDLKGTEQYPKKTRGAGAEPRDTRKGSQSEKGDENG